MEGTRDEAHGIVQPELCEQNMTILGRSTLLLNSKAAEQMTAECWLVLVPQVEPASFTNKFVAG